MRFLPQTLMTRLVSSFLLLSLIIVGLVVVLAYNLARQSLTESVFERLQAAAAVKAEQIGRWVDSQRREVIYLASQPAIKRFGRTLVEQPPESADRITADRLRSLLELAVINMPDLKEVFLLTDRGARVVVSTSPENEGQYRVSDGYFTAGRFQTYVQPVHPSPISLEPTMTVATPLTAGDGQRLGVLAAHLDLSRMDRITLERTGLGRTGEAYLVDRVNVFVSAERFGRPQYRRGVHSFGIDEAVEGRVGRGIYDNYNGVPVLGVYSTIPDLGLALLVEMDRDEALGQARELAATIALVGLGSAILLAVGVIFLARQIARPVLAVARAAAKVAGGDLSVRAEVMTSDEIGTLARAFNQMTARLDTLYLGLEEKVDQLREAERHIRESREYYRRFFEQDLTGDFVADPEGRIISCNPAFIEIFGFDSRKQAEAANLAGLFDPEEGFRGFIQRLTAESKLEYFEARMKRADGGPVHVVANLIGVFDETGGLARIQGYLFNDTGRKELEEQLRHAQKMEAIGRLAGGVAHDFNNLMTAVTGYSELVLTKLRPDDPLRPSIEEIAKAGVRAASLTGQLLAFSRRQVLQPAVLDLNQVIADLEVMLSRLLDERIRFETRLADDLGRIKADAGQLQQILMNLVLNARDAMDQGGDLVILTENVRSGSEDGPAPEKDRSGFIRLAVIDTGKGMDQTVQERIFEPFFTTKEQGRGTGLGLATVHGVVEQSGGRITVWSSPGGGTTFNLYLPRVDGEPSTPAKTWSPVGPGEGPESGSETVLLVEDEDQVRALVREILVAHGHRVYEAENGLEAIRLFRESLVRPGILVTDVIMPGLSGSELAARLRKTSPELAVLFISGYTDQDLDDRELARERTGFLQKPFRPTALLREIRRLMDEVT